MRDYWDYVEECREHGQDEPLTEAEWTELMEELHNG